MVRSQPQQLSKYFLLISGLLASCITVNHQGDTILQFIFSSLWCWQATQLHVHSYSVLFSIPMCAVPAPQQSSPFYWGYRRICVSPGIWPGCDGLGRKDTGPSSPTDVINTLGCIKIQNHCGKPHRLLWGTVLIFQSQYNLVMIRNLIYVYLTQTTVWLQFYQFNDLIIANEQGLHKMIDSTNPTRHIQIHIFHTM